MKMSTKAWKLVIMSAVTLILILMAGYEEAEKERRKEQQRQEEIDLAVREHAGYAKKYYDAMRAGEYDEALKWKNILNSHHQELYILRDTQNCNSFSDIPDIDD